MNKPLVILFAALLVTGFLAGVGYWIMKDEKVRNIVVILTLILAAIAALLVPIVLLK